MKRKNIKLGVLISSLTLMLMLSSVFFFKNETIGVAHGGYQPGPTLFSIDGTDVAHGGYQPGPPLFTIFDHSIA